MPNEEDANRVGYRLRTVSTFTALLVQPLTDVTGRKTDNKAERRSYSTGSIIIIVHFSDRYRDTVFANFDA